MVGEGRASCLGWRLQRVEEGGRRSGMGVSVQVTGCLWGVPVQAENV